MIDSHELFPHWPHVSRADELLFRRRQIMEFIALVPPPIARFPLIDSQLEELAKSIGEMPK